VRHTGKVLFLLFTIVPIVETWLLVVLGRAMGFWPTVALILLSGMVGAWLAKHEGLRVLRRWQESLAAGRVPEEGVLSAVLVLAGGVLLIAPGVLTDVTGLVLLFPPTRRIIAGWVRRFVERRIERGTIRVVTVTHGAPPRAQPRDVIDVAGEEIDSTPVRHLPHDVS
jgi:UPF0716 protein FxsA